MLDIAAILASVRVLKWPPRFYVICEHCGRTTIASPQILEHMAEAGRAMAAESGPANEPEMYLKGGCNDLH